MIELGLMLKRQEGELVLMLWLWLLLSSPLMWLSSSAGDVRRTDVATPNVVIFLTKGAYSRTLKIKWKTKTAEDEDTRRNYDVLLLVEVDEEVNETEKDKNTSFG